MSSETTDPRHATAELLREHSPLEHRALAVIESITDPFYLVDADWRFVYVNERALAYLNRERQELVGQVLWDVFPEVESSEFSVQYRRAVAEGRTAEFETLSPVTGRVVEVRAYPSSGGLSVTFRDVTDRRRAEARNRLLVRLDDEIRVETDAEAITRSAAQLLGQHLDADRCAYGESQPGSDTFDVLGDYRRGLPSMVGRYDLAAFGEAIAADMRRGTPVVIDDVETDERTRDGLDAYRASGIGALIAVPVIKEGGFAGGMSVHQRVARAWQPFELELVSAVASRCWESLERVRLTRTLVRKTRAFSVLADNGTRLLAEEHPQALIGAMFQKASDLANVEICLHFLTTPDRHDLQLAASLGLSEEQLQSRLWELDRALCGVTSQTRTLTVHAPVRRGGDRASELLHDLGIRAYVCFPLTHDGDLVGTLSFGTRRRDAFAPDELDFLHALSDQVAAAYGRARAATALRESEERLLQAAAIAGLGTFDTDFGTGEMAVNDPGRDIYGWGRDERLTFERAVRQFHPEDRDRVVAIVRAAIDRPHSDSFDVEHRIVRTDGTPRWLRVRGRALFERVGGELRPVRCLGTFIDMTDRKDAEERRERMLETERAARAEAERLGRLKDEFLATVSHELRTPLNAILGWSQLLRRRPMGVQETLNAIEVIDRNARAQAQLIDDLLDMSRFVSGSIRIDMQEVDLAAIALASVQSIQPAADAKRLRLRQALDPRGAIVMGDPSRLQQVVWNLLSNALKFTGPGGTIDVRVERLGERAELTVADTGAGIRRDFLPHIFEPFRQQDASSTRRHGGVGLGLSIVKQLVDVHGGEVHVSSDGEGAGASFMVSLPLAHAGELPAADTADDGLTAASGPAPRLAGTRVLIVEDDADTLALLLRVLRDAGAVALGASCANDALELARRESVDLIVTDIGMPEIDGYGLLQRVRAADAPLRAVPAVAVTAYAHAGEERRAADAGFEAFLAKPVDVERLLDVAARLLNR